LEASHIWIYPSVLSPTERLIKRVLDVLLAVLLIGALSPVIFVTALLVLIKDGRPIFYSDERAGLFGRPFRVRKFRTMLSGADQQRAELWAQSSTEGPAFKLANDPRVTGLGRVLRRFSLDELPQLFDVVAGRMSLVGPRPAGLDELARYEDRHRLRLTVRPGVTGLWQVRRRLDDNFEQRMSDDLEYIQRWSIVFDLIIVLRTIRVVFAGRGV
jgi:lipopolysaccharide/colanic/teichoic acid biosynthesis glycosyltransferase